MPGVGTVTPAFEDRGMPFSRDEETATASYYSVKMHPREGGSVQGEHASSTCLFIVRLFREFELTSDTSSLTSWTP